MGTAAYYRDLYARVGNVTGWDFSRLSVVEVGCAWDFYAEVIARCTPDTVLLDIGTGGGEKALAVAAHVRLLVGIDIAAEMVRTAQRNLAASGARNVRFHEMAAESLQFPAGFFDVVSCRHSAFAPAEVARVLRDGGVFLTQQVGEADKRNIKQAFGRGQCFGERDGAARDAYASELRRLGLVVQTDDYDATEFYRTAEDLIFLLRNTPIIPDFGQDPADFAALARFIDENQTEKGIKTNSRRYMIVARKQ